MILRQPLRLRDARRIVARASRDTFERLFKLEQVLGLGLVKGHSSLSWRERAEAMARLLDDLIRQYGPDRIIALEEQTEERPQADRTDHQVGADAPISDGPHTTPDAGSHGGDGNSGECDHPAETAAKSRKGGGTDQCPTNESADASGGEAGSDIDDITSSENRSDDGTPDQSSSGAEPQGSGRAPSAGGNADQGRHRAVKETESQGSGCPGGGRTPSGCDAGDPGSPERAFAACPSVDHPATPSDADPDPARAPIADDTRSHSGREPDSARARGSDAEAEANDVEASEQAAPRNRDHADQGVLTLADILLSHLSNFSKIQQPQPREERPSGLFSGGAHAVDFARECVALPDREAAEISAALRRLLDVVGAKSDRVMPRVEPRALVRELVSRRYAIHRAYRRQPQPRMLMFMPDMSGSCAWIARITGGVATSIAKTDDRVLVCPTAWGSSHHEGVIGEVIGTHAPLVVQALAPMRKGLSIEKLKFLGEDPKHWEALRAVGVTHLLVLGDVHGHKAYTAAAKAGVRVLWCDPNARTMVVDKSERNQMAAYVAITDGSPRAITAAIRKAVMKIK